MTPRRNINEDLIRIYITSLDGETKLYVAWMGSGFRNGGNWQDAVHCMEGDEIYKRIMQFLDETIPQGSLSACQEPAVNNKPPDWERLYG